MLMVAAARFLDVLNIQDRGHFLRNYVTTIGHTIYTPFEVGVETEQWPLWRQVRVCAHECTHVVQVEREGWATFDARYLASSSWRAGYEAEACGADLELEFWRQGAALNIPAFVDERVAGLASYGCSDEDIGQAWQQLTIRAGVVAQGGVETRAAQVAIAWLEEHAPGLRGAT
jgi:hypothetical protein